MTINLTTPRPAAESRALALVSAVFFLNGQTGEVDTCLSVDPLAVSLAPIGEGVWVDIHPLDDVSLSLESILGFLRSLEPLFPGREIIGRFEL